MTDLINTLEAPGEFDALCKLRPGEPYFPLIGRDGFAPELVENWADFNRRRSLRDYDEGKIDAETRDRELRKSTQAEMIACDMRAYKRGHAVPVTMPVVGKPTYTGIELDDETRQRDAIQSARIKTSAAINGTVAELVILDELWEGHDDVATRIRSHIETLNDLSTDIQPKRPGIDA